jgi:hypothetical protein
LGLLHTDLYRYGVDALAVIGAAAKAWLAR